MTTQPTHTPTPWKVKYNTDGEGSSIYDQDGNVFIGTTTMDKNAAFIVRAVNAYAPMVEALQACLNSEYVDSYGTRIPVIKGELRQQIAIALEKAEGRS